MQYSEYLALEFHEADVRNAEVALGRRLRAAEQRDERSASGSPVRRRRWFRALRPAI